MPEIDQAGMEKAHQSRIEGNYEEARDAYVELTQAAEDCAEGWWGLGLTIMNMGEFDEAIECLEKAAELEPSNQRYLLDLGKHYAMLGMDDEAKDSFEKVVAIDASSREGGEATTQLTYY